MTPALVVCFRWNSNRAFYITNTKFYEKNMYDSTKYMLEKKRFFHVVRPQIKVSPRGQRPPLPTLSVNSTPLHCLTCVARNWWSFCRGLLNEQHFHLTRLWVYFIRWLLLTGAFWLYSAHLGSLWAVWHVSQITTRGSSHLKPSSFRSFTQGLFIFCWFTFFCLVENNGF